MEWLVVVVITSRTTHEDSQSLLDKEKEKKTTKTYTCRKQSESRGRKMYRGMGVTMKSFQGAGQSVQTRALKNFSGI